MHDRLFPHPELLQEQLQAFMDQHIYPNEEHYHAQLNALPNRFSTVPLMEELKAKAREAGLWNLFMPAYHGGLTNEQYAPLAEIMGRVMWSPEAFNCNAPDTGNMEVFMKYGTPEQQERWLKPLLAGEIRSSYCMTEPDVASSDATNVQTSIRRDGDSYVVNGRKWFITNAMYERCAIFIVMGKSDPDNPNRHIQQSQILVPKNTPGVKVLRPLTTLGYDDAPIGHAEVLFDNVRVPAENILLGEGRGFEIAQGRLGPGRLHHCMRLIGCAQRALEFACRRAVSSAPTDFWAKRASVKPSAGKPFRALPPWSGNQPDCISSSAPVSCFSAFSDVQPASAWTENALARSDAKTPGGRWLSSTDSCGRWLWPPASCFFFS